MTDYHEQWTANKDLEEEFGYKVGESDRATDWGFESREIKTSYTDYGKFCADASYVERGEIFAATFLLTADRCQYGSIITQLRNDYTKVQQTYPSTVQKVQALLTVWEEEKSPMHRYNNRLSFANIMNDRNGDWGHASNDDAQATGGHPSHGVTTKTCRFY